MATFNHHYFYGGKNLGLRKCPFNSTHRVKDAKYAKHVLKCEQQFPKRHSLVLCPKNRNSIESVFTLSASDSFETSSATKTNDNSTSSDDLCQSDSEVNESVVFNQQKESPIPDSVRETLAEVTETVVCNVNEENRNISQINDKNEENVSQISKDLSQIKINDNNTNEVNKEVSESERNESNESNSASNTNNPNTNNAGNCSRVVTKEVIRSESNNVYKSCDKINVSDKESEENWTNGEHFSLYDINKSYDDLTEEEIMEMAESFVDVVVLSRMSKTQRQKFNNKLVELRKAEKARKLKALNELISVKYESDPQMDEIPLEIRKPNVDIRQMFKLRKYRNDGTEKPNGEKSCPNLALSSPPNHTDVHKHIESERCDQKNVQTFCNNCLQSLALNESNIKQLTVFCAKCSGVKFGGYFECQSCKLYGYFANNQIHDHMSKHFPTVAKPALDGTDIKENE